MTTLLHNTAVVAELSSNWGWLDSLSTTEVTQQMWQRMVDKYFSQKSEGENYTAAFNSGHNRELKAKITNWWQNYQLRILILGLVFLGLGIGDFPNPKNTSSQLKISCYHQLLISTFSSLIQRYSHADVNHCLDQYKAKLDEATIKLNPISWIKWGCLPVPTEPAGRAAVQYLA